MRYPQPLKRVLLKPAEAQRPLAAQLSYYRYGKLQEHKGRKELKPNSLTLTEPNRMSEPNPNQT